MIARFRSWFLALFLMLTTGWFGSEVMALTAPKPTGHVNDYANMLSEPFETQLETQLQSLATASGGAEIVVVTVPSLQGDTIENVAQAFFDQWKIGQGTSNNGLLFLIALEERTLRLHTGYGTETVLNDALAGRIARNTVTPFFKNNEYEQGIQAGVDELVKIMNNPEAWAELAPEPTQPQKPAIPGSVMGMLLYFGLVFGTTLVSYIVAFFGRTKSWWPGGLVGFGLGWLLWALNGALIFGLIGLILDYILSKNYRHWQLEHKATGWRQTWGGFHTSRSSGGGFGGFSGGSSGGGGASSRW